ncbi:sigma-70 family RNA polymerase sigma factor [Candidatus Micrarchaeota archaeon]|nr:sigma-70 family RNA polymerase sigma factor [Candidatus Micrarchaeota archaeon]
MSPELNTETKDIPGLSDILAGEETGWETFYKHFFPIVLTQVYREGIVSTLNGNTEAQDIAHDVLTKIAQNGTKILMDLGNKTEFGVISYLKTVVKNHHKDLIRRKMRNLEVHMDDLLGPIDDSDESSGLDIESFVSDRPFMVNPAAEYSLKEWEERINECLKYLRPQYVIIIKMLMAKSSHHEIAEKLGVNVKCVGALINRARGQLRKELTKE